MNCRICDRDPSSVIATSPLAEAFFPVDPLAPLHMVVAVREHRPAFTDLDPAEAVEVMGLALRLARLAGETDELEKFYLASVGDVDRHFHLHLLPKRSADPGLGPFIFSTDGWRGRLSPGDDTARERLLARMAAEGGS